MIEERHSVNRLTYTTQRRPVQPFSFVSHGQYVPLPPRWPAWLWRIVEALRHRLWWGLSKPIVTERIEVHRHEVQEDSILDLIRNTNCDMLGQWGCKAVRMIVGPRQLAIADNEALARLPPMRFAFPFQSSTGQRTILGVEVQVIPWFDGVLLLPKDEEQA